MKNLARISILNDVLLMPQAGQLKWTDSTMSRCTVEVGDLVSIYSIDNNKIKNFYLSWVKEVTSEDFTPKYLLESIETGEEAYFKNIGVVIYDRERVEKNPQWKWTDEQTQLYNKFLKLMNLRIRFWFENPNFNESQFKIDFSHPFFDTKKSFSFENYETITDEEMKKISKKITEELLNLEEKSSK